MSIISLKNVSKFYRNKTTVSSGFTKINLDLDMGEFVVITGESGSGKSTLLNVISGLDSYEEGEMYINGEETSHFTESDYEEYRRKYIGNIFQNFNLINSYTVFQNIELVLLLNGYKRKEVKNKVLEIIETVGLSKYKNTKASKLSGGQKQRVAIARALAKDTPIIVADEPTGNLDVKSAKSIMKLLSEISKNKLVVIVTHNYEQVSEYATRKIAMNDGHIIEDKKMQPHEKCSPEEIEYKDITTSNKILLSFRNAFNIKTKFLLLFAVYFFLTLLVFSEYSGVQKQDFTDSLEGYNNVFGDTSPNRVIVNKKNKTPFTKEELQSLTNLSNVDYIYENDTLLDASGTLFDDNYGFYFQGTFRESKKLTQVDEGRLPNNQSEIVIVAARDSYTIEFYKDEIFTKEYSLQENMRGTLISKVKIVGIVYDDDMDEYDMGIIYLQDDLLSEIKNNLNYQYNDITLKINGKNISNDLYSQERIIPNKNVGRGLAYVYPSIANYCQDLSCTNKKMEVDIKNIYEKKNKSLTIVGTVNTNNYKLFYSDKNYDEISDTILINDQDYKEMFESDTYQISLFLKDIKKGNDTLEELENRGYDYYYLKDNLVNPGEQLRGVIKIIRNVMFIVATIVLFFISYFIIKIILKSRNVYFSTIRILGATQKVSRRLLNMELFIDANVAYLFFLILIIVSKLSTSWKYIQDLVTYFTWYDYILVYLVLMLMSLLISNRYANKLFKDSAMNTYREEV